MQGLVSGIFIAPEAGGRMVLVPEVEAIAGAGLKGDRYCAGLGSFNRGEIGKRQVTLINGLFIHNSGFDPEETRRNIVVVGVELMWLIGREFQVGNATLKGVKYCDPCPRPSKLSSKAISFREAFLDRGGLMAEVVIGGLIEVGSSVIPPPKGY